MSNDRNPEAHRELRSHWIPRTARGKFLLVFFGLMYLLTQWPVLEWANTIQPLVVGLPFLFIWLSGVYLLLTLALLYTAIKKL